MHRKVTLTAEVVANLPGAPSEVEAVEMILQGFMSWLTGTAGVRAASATVRSGAVGRAYEQVKTDGTGPVIARA